MLAWLAPAAAALAGLAPCLGAQAQRLSLEQTVPGRAEAVLFYALVPDLTWAPDGHHLIAEPGGSRLWIDPATGRLAVDHPVDGVARRRAELQAALAVLDELDAAEAAAAAAAADTTREGPVWVAHRNDLYAWIPGGSAKRLTFDGAPKLEVELSPNGRHLAFVRGGNLFVVAVESGAERALTRDGGPELLNGRLDWVYQEEVYERGNFKGYWWSPQGDRIVSYRLDESPVKEFTLIDHVPDPTLLHERAVAPEVMRYPKAGDPNPVVGIRVFDVAGGGEPVAVDLSGYDADILVVRAGWTADGSRVVLQVQNRIQTWLDLCLVDPSTGAVTRLLREQAAHGWVDVLDQPRWLADGSFLWLSERSGYKHVLHCEAGGALRRAVTGGEWSVGEILAVDQEAGQLWFTATRDGAVNRNAYRIGLDGQGLVRLTRGDGCHDVRLSPDRSRFLDTFSSLQSPPELRLCDGKDGAVLRVLQRAEVPARAKYGFVPHELLEIPARDGYLMDATLLKPADFDPERRYAVLLEAYSGPDHPTVVNEWNAGADAFHQFLAQQGVLVLQVNNRSSSGRGQVDAAACYKSLGASELRDLEDAVDWLCRHPWADPARVAISGWSFGGTMAAYALTHSDRFALGVAGAGVYDWRLYDTIYTERYMDTPQANAAGYDRSSSIRAAADLRGHLVLVHGTMDDNVHLQNAMHLALALQQAGKDFELMLYPKAQHGLVDVDQSWHLRRLMWRAIRERLLPAGG